MATDRSCRRSGMPGSFGMYSRLCAVWPAKQKNEHGFCIPLVDSKFPYSWYICSYRFGSVLRIWLYIHIHIYIYMCVRVCVCVCQGTSCPSSFQSWGLRFGRYVHNNKDVLESFQQQLDAVHITFLIQFEVEDLGLQIYSGQIVH